MKIYRVAIYNHQEGHQGFSYHSSKSAAASAIREAIQNGHTGSETEEIEVTTTKAGIISALNQYGGHADNG